MRLDPEAREAVEAALIEAHDGGGTTRGIAGRFVRLIRDLERFGHPWVDAYLEDLMVTGAMKVCGDWRRKSTVKARNKTGVVDLPAFVGRTNEDGEAVQEPLTGLDLTALEAHRARLRAQRDTLSREVAALTALADLMADRPELSTVGDALAVLMEQAA